MSRILVKKLSQHFVLNVYFMNVDLTRGTIFIGPMDISFSAFLPRQFSLQTLFFGDETTQYGSRAVNEYLRRDGFYASHVTVRLFTQIRTQYSVVI